jgi:hypothetical protein
MSSVIITPKYDAAEKLTIVEEWQDCEAIIERNKALKSERQKSDWGRHIATIPNIFITKWLHEEWDRGNSTIKFCGPEFDALVERKLKDPDYYFLRTDK